MRNTEAQRYARWSLAAAGLLAVLVAGVYARNVWLARQAQKKAPPAVPPTIEQLSNEFSYSKVEGQRTIYTIKASRATQFREGNRNLLEDVDVIVYGKKGDRDDKLRTRACDFISDTGKITCAGEVQISLLAAGTAHTSTNAILVKTSAVTFDRDSSQAKTDKPVTFRWPAGEGHALGMSYDSNSGTLRLAHNVELNISKLPGQAAEKRAGGVAQNLGGKASEEKDDASSEKNVHLTSDSLSFQRETRIVRMEGEVLAQKETLKLSAQKLTLELDFELRAKRLVASGVPRLEDSPSQGPAALNAHEISANLRPDGSVDSIMAIGNVHGSRDTALGEEEIDAGRVQMDLASRQNIPNLLTASEGVILTSEGSAPNTGTRRVESDALEIHFSKDSSPSQTLIESINTLAPARVQWRNVATENGKPVPQFVQMAGKHMVLNFKGQNQLQQLLSSDGVELTRKIGDSPEEVITSHDLAAKFDEAGQWTTIDQSGAVRFADGQRSAQGDRAHLDRAANLLGVNGSVVISDAGTRTTANSASFDRGSNLLRADGHVLTTELNSAASTLSNFAQEPAHISATHLILDRVNGHAVYSGEGRLWQGQSVIEGDVIDLDNATRTLVAKGHVRGVFPQAAWNPPPGSVARQSMGQLPAQSSVHSTSAGKLSSTEASSTRGLAKAPPLGRVEGALLTYWETESRARIEQNARADMEQGSIQANQIDLYFSDTHAASGNKQLTRAVATGDVSVHQEDKRGASDRAEYTTSDGKFVLSGGNPTLYSSSGDSTTGRQLTFYFADDRIVVDSTEGSKTVTLHAVEK